MLDLDDGFQLADAVGYDDGSFVTSLIDQEGNNVGSITRLFDGTVTSTVPETDYSGGSGFDFSKLLGKVTGFLDNVATTARSSADEATRISRGVQGAAAGAKAGYNAPVGYTPLLIAGAAILVAVVAVAAAAGSHSSRRR